MRRMALLGVLLLSACDDSIPGLCNVDSDCSTNICYRGVCIVPDDAGSADDAGSSSDASATSDAGSTDAGTTSDAGSADAAGSMDASLEADAGARDAGGDAGPVAPQDAGSPDAASGSLTITDPPADGTCAAVCTGAVVRASDDTYAFKGTAPPSLDLRELAWSISLDKAVVASGTTPVAGGTWSVAWDTKNLKDDGAMYAFSITAGNGAQSPSPARRSVWVDRVAPKLVAGASGYGVAPDSALLEFSEPMDAASVLSRARLNGIPVGGSFGSSDGIHFKFASASDLQPYTLFELVINAGATDRAGNPMDSASQRFVTPIVQPPLGPQTVGTAFASSPRLAIDPAGRPFIAYATTAQPHVVYWDGLSSWVDVELTSATLTGAAPRAFLIPSTKLDVEAASHGNVGGRMHILLSTGSNLYYTYASGSPRSSDWQVEALSSNASGADFVRSPGPGVGTQSLPVLAALFAEGENFVYRAITSSRVYPAVVLDVIGADFWKTAKYIDPLMPSGPISDVGFAGGALGQARISSGAAYMLWSHPRLCGNVNCEALWLSCSPNPAVAGSWKQPTEVASFRAGLYVNEDVDSFAVSDTTVAVAYSIMGSGYFLSTAVGDCTSSPASPTPSQLGSTVATSLSVALGPPNGSTVWGAWIDSSRNIEVSRNK